MQPEQQRPSKQSQTNSLGPEREWEQNRDRREVSPNEINQKNAP